MRLPRPANILLALSWMLLIWALSSASFEKPPGGPSFVWKVIANMAHAPLFGILSLFVASAVLPRGPIGTASLTRSRAGLSLGIVACYGAIDELHQSWTPGRHPSPLDVVTDITGGLCVLWVVAAVVQACRGEQPSPSLAKRLGVGVVACASVALVVTLAD